MPELPEVETTRIGIAPYILGETVDEIIIRNHQLRWPVNKRLVAELPGQEIRQVKRRGKYLLLITAQSSLIIHLGMSGNLRILLKSKPAEKHDHIDVHFQSGVVLRFNDPRRFGCFIHTKRDPYQHKLLCALGPEPLSDEFNSDYLFEKSRNRSQLIKTFIMDSKVVVGVGNIYANESLFSAGIHPKRRANNISQHRYEQLIVAIKDVLQQAIQKGGTTLRDFINSEGKPGYFRNELNVYDRADEDCVNCQRPIKHIRIAQRSSFYCSQCQR